MRMMQERRTGVFGTVQNEEAPSQERRFLRETSPDDPQTIYNLLFRDYDEERQS